MTLDKVTLRLRERKLNRLPNRVLVVPINLIGVTSMTDTNAISAVSLPPDDLALSGVLPDFASRGWGLPDTVKYPDLWRAIVNGRLPARMVNGRYKVARTDLPTYAAFLRLTPPAQPKQARKANAALDTIAA